MFFFALRMPGVRSGFAFFVEAIDFAGLLLFGLTAGGAEEALNEVEAFVGQDTGGDFAGVVEGGIGLEEVDPAACGSGFGVGTAENDAAGAAVDDGACAHGAGFFGDVEGALFEAPIAHSVLCGGEAEHFGVGGGVLEGLDLVPGAGDDFSLADDDGTDGDLADGSGFVCLA